MPLKEKQKKKQQKTKNKPHKVRRLIVTNPNGANQYLLDPRQKVCWSLYVDPRSDTFCNAYRSALAAGYTNRSALQISNEQWFIQRKRRLNLLDKAEDVLQEMINLDTTNKIIKGDEVIITQDPSLVKVKQDTAKFLAERLGKKYYSAREEITGGEGEDLFPDNEAKNKANEAIANFLNEQAKRNNQDTSR